MVEIDLREIDFTSLGPENLLRLGQDFMRALPSVTRDLPRSRVEEGLVDLISETVERHGTSKTSLSLQDATELADTFRQASLRLQLSDSSMRDLWIRLYVHALLRGSYIFTDLQFPEPPAESPTFERSPFERSGFVDVWRGEYHGNPVCIKFIRTREKANLRKMKKIFHQEGQVCKNFSHPNILPVVQVSQDLFPFCIMSPWMPGGNIMQYTKKNPSANRLMLLAEVCHGLSHLHGLNIPHGCIAPNNILITRDGRACLGDFGVVEGFGELPYTRFKLGTMRYMAVERLDLTGSPASKESDVYSLAMTAFTVLTGITPYIDVNGYITLIVRIKSGDRPSRPTNLAGSRLMPDDVWDMITSCWNDVPGLRSDISSMYEVFLASSLQEVHRVKTDIRTGERKRSSKKIRSRLADFFQSLLVSEPEIKRLVNDMDQRLENQTMSDKERRRLFNELCKTCSRRRVIPDSMYIPDRSNEATVEYTGGFATVSRSAYGGHQVAIKVINVYTNTLNTTRSGFCREVVAWKHLRHPNILPLLGVTFDDDYFSMVSEWMDNGNINEFILKDPDANRTALLADVANGLKYMHDLSIVHGDIKGANILINKDRRGCIADFSLTTITGVGSHPAHGVTPIATTFSGDTLMSFTAGGTYRWMSPELLDPDQFGIPKEEEGRPTRQSDCYALGMVIYEVLCGHSPFIEKENSLMLTSEIVNGVRPTKPEGAERLGFNNELWTIVERCWQGIIVERPGIDDILSCLNDATAFWYMREL